MGPRTILGPHLGGARAPVARAPVARVAPVVLVAVAALLVSPLVPGVATGRSGVPAAAGVPGRGAAVAPDLPRLRRSVPVDQSWAVPNRAWIRIPGHGYGHGHGLSQYGAQGAAREGLTYRQITGFYYPGTAWGTAAGQVSVLVSVDTTSDVVVAARSGLRVRALASTTSLVLPENGADRWRLTPAATGTVVSFRTDAWHRWRLLAGDAEFTAQGAVLTLFTPAGARTYRGRLRSASPPAGSTTRDTVNVVSLEAYLRGVVPLEMPASWRPAAVRSQAVAARSYAAYERAHPRADHYQICDTPACQVYGGAAAEHPDSNAAVSATAGMVRTWEGQPAFTQFSASNGGWTAAGSVPYLTAQPDPYDPWPGNPYRNWSVTVSDRVLEQHWPGIGNLRRIRVTARDGHGQWRGRVSSMTLVGGRGQVTLTGDAFRSSLGLRSTWFTFAVSQR